MFHLFSSRNKQEIPPEKTINQMADSINDQLKDSLELIEQIQERVQEWDSTSANELLWQVGEQLRSIQDVSPENPKLSK